MLVSRNPRTFFSLFTVLLSQTRPTSATPFRRELGATLEGDAILVNRACANPCGWEDKYCCPGPGQCYTDVAGQAQCAATAGGAGNFAVAQATAGGYIAYYTTTWVDTVFITHTATYTSTILYTTTPTITAQAAAPSCNYAQMETNCGTRCCPVGYTCGSNQDCVFVGGGSSVYYNSLYSYAPPQRPTSGGVVITSVVGGAIPFQTAVPTGAVIGAATAAPTNNGLSGGAIAGIVIGVLLGIILLLLICFYCCLRAGLDGLLALFGLKPRGRRTSETIIEEHHHASGGWFGRRPTRVDTVVETRPPKKSGLGGLGGVAAGLAGLAVLLGLKRRHDRYDDKSDSYTSYTSTSTYTSTSSSSSSDRRTRDSRSHASRSHR